MDRTVGPYRLGDSLGMTPFGELVTATHSARSEPLAVLLLDDRLAKDYRFRGLLRLEIARAGGLRHTSVARAIEVGEHGGAPYVVFERPAESVTLARAYADGDPPSREQAVALVRHLAEGLDAAHGRRLAHGVLSPPSVLIGASGSAALVGVAVAGAIDEGGLTEILAERIEAAFVAPEQRGGKRALATADGYALGVLAGALLRIQPPPAGPADAVGLVLGRQHSADPAARFPSCEAFATALAEALAPSATATAPATPGRANASLAPAAPPSPAVPRTTDAPAPVPSPDAMSATSTPVTAGSATTTSPPQLSTSSTVPTPAPPGAERASRPDSASVVQAAPTPELELPESSPAPPSGPPTSPPQPFSPAPAEAVPPSDLGSWFQRVIDPPGQQRRGPHLGQALPGRAGQQPPTTAPLPDWVVAEIPPSEVSVTRSAPTDAMRAVLQTGGPRDYIGEGIELLGDRVPSLGEMVERFAPNGKIGRAPLGVAAVSALAALLLIAGQAWPATVLVMVLVVLYGVPWLGAKLTASERVNPEAVRVRGTAQIRRTASTLGNTPELVLMNGGLTLSLRDAEYAALSSVGQPQTLERPVYPHGGVQQVVVGYLLPDALVTYLEPGRTLLDVRLPNQSVLFRRPPYTGELGDVTWTPSDAAFAPDGPASSEGVGDVPVRSTESEAVLPAAASTAPRRPGATTTLPLPPAVADSLTSAAASTQRTAIVMGAIAIVAYFVITYLFPSFGLFGLIFVGILAVNIGGTAFTRALKLWNARGATSMVRVVGPVIVSRYRSGKTHRHEARLYDGTVIKIDRETHLRLSSDAEVRVEPSGWSFDGNRQSANGYLESEHEVPAATTFYEPSSLLLLEVRNPFGAALYRDPAVPEGALSPE